MNQYLIQYYPPRPTFVEDATAGESKAVGRHFEYLKSLLEDRILILAGRTDDASVGLFVFEAENEAAAEIIMKNDPAVQAGVFSAELKLFRLALLRA